MAKAHLVLGCEKSRKSTGFSRKKEPFCLLRDMGWEGF
jgi:hypothetical protein